MFRVESLIWLGPWDDDDDDDDDDEGDHRGRRGPETDGDVFDVLSELEDIVRTCDGTSMQKQCQNIRA